MVGLIQLVISAARDGRKKENQIIILANFKGYYSFRICVCFHFTSKKDEEKFQQVPHIDVVVVYTILRKTIIF